MLLHKRIWAVVVILFIGSPAVRSQNPPLPGFPGNVSRVPIITGQVVISDGTKLSESVQIQIVCRGRVRAELYSDTLGSFNFDLSRMGGIFASQPADASVMGQSLDSGSEWDDCSARAVLAGFSSDSVEFGSHIRELGVADIGKIRLRPLHDGAKTSLSISSLLAPKSARKAMDKGLVLEEQRKWPQAEQSFRKAIEIYPEYAAAWSELGRMQYVQQNFPGAHESFQRAAEIDPGYVRPYLGLTQLAMDERNWPDVVRFSDKALALDSVSYPSVWLLNATGQYNLHNYDAAETSVRNGKRADTEHRIKQFHALWMQILSARNADAAFVGQSPRIRFGVNRHVWGDHELDTDWLR